MKSEHKIVSTASMDNLELGCAMIKRAVIAKSLIEIENDETF